MRAEYDHDNHRVTQIDDNGRITQIAPRVLGARVEWYPVEVVYPEGYNPRFPQLLNWGVVEYTLDEGEGVVVINYPEADFSPAAIRQELRDTVDRQVRELLGRSDWQVIREVETNKPMDAATKAERASHRQTAARVIAEINSLRDDEVGKFNPNIDPDRSPRFVNELPTPEPEQPLGGDGDQWITDATEPGGEGEPVERAEPGDRHPNGPKGPRL